jgi:predicted O-methyltransferase YrrM
VTRELLHRYVRVGGDAFDSERIAGFLHALARLQRPGVVVEFGRALGISTLHLGLALAENGHGHMWSVDDEQLAAQLVDVAHVARRLRDDDVLPSAPAEPRALVETMAEAIGVADRLTLTTARIEVDRPDVVPAQSVPREPIDLLFSDFNHGPEAVLRILAWALPRIAPSASIVFDSASTWWPSWLALEHTVALLSAGRVPMLLQEWSGTELGPAVAGRRFTLVALTRPGADRQNGAAWIKVDPIDLVPWPRTQMRSPTAPWPAW